MYCILFLKINLKITKNNRINCKINCKSIYILIFSCFFCLVIAFNLVLLLENNLFFKLVISKLHLYIKLKFNIKEEIILYYSFFTIKIKILNLLYNLETTTNFIKFL